jgi:glyoxylase-like metal-dependent hydrolase (beta-lactamase superfamily II)
MEAAPGQPDVIRIVAPNPGPMTLQGTNTYLVGRDRAYVVDPGPAIDSHVKAVRVAADERGGIGGVVLTHSDADHSAAVPALDAPLLWGRVSEGGGDPRQPVEEPPERIGPFSAVPTPGHAADHVSYVWGDVCFCGDLVLGEGSTIVGPSRLGGSLPEYMSSLERLAELDVRLLCPGHGAWITDPPAKLREYREHRLERERRLLAALAGGERSRHRLLDAVWDDVPDVLRPMAALAMEAHLEKLNAEGRLPGDLRD